MSVYWLTFRLADNATYSDRFEALNEAVKNLATRWWFEPTSFYLFEAEAAISDVASAIKEAVDERVDIALIGMPYVKAARLIGNSEDDDIFALMDFTKKA